MLTHSLHDYLEEKWQKPKLAVQKIFTVNYKSKTSCKNFPSAVFIVVSPRIHQGGQEDKN